MICYEFLYGIPPFHADTPDEVFENILSREIDWHENEVEVSPEARDFMERLMCADPDQRLGAKGAGEVKKHPFFKNVNWDTLMTETPAFIPQPENLEDTEYFDSRGASMDHVDDAKITDAQARDPEDGEHVHGKRSENVEGSGDVDFGTFVFKNLPVLERANEDVIRKLRHENLIANPVSGMNVDPVTGKIVHKSQSSSTRRRVPSISDFVPSPLVNVTSSTSTPIKSSSSDTVFTNARHHRLLDQSVARKTVHPLRLRTMTLNGNDRQKMDIDAMPKLQRRLFPSPLDLEMTPLPPIKRPTIAHRNSTEQGQTEQRPDRGLSRPLDCLVADDNPISCKIMEMILQNLGCRCVVVRNGAEAIRCAMGGVRFDIILMDIRMPISK